MIDGMIKMMIKLLIMMIRIRIIDGDDNDDDDDQPFFVNVAVTHSSFYNHLII